MIRHSPQRLNPSIQVLANGLNQHVFRHFEVARLPAYHGIITDKSEDYCNLSMLQIIILATWIIILAGLEEETHGEGDLVVGNKLI